MKTQPRQHISNEYNTYTVVTSPVYIESKVCLKKKANSLHMVDKLERKWWIFYEIWILSLDPRFFKQQKKSNILLNQPLFAVY